MSPPAKLESCIGRSFFDRPRPASSGRKRGAQSTTRRSGLALVATPTVTDLAGSLRYGTVAITFVTLSGNIAQDGARNSLEGTDVFLVTDKTKFGAQR